MKILPRNLELVLFLRKDSINAVWAVLDQGVISLANFGLNFALARYASPDVYGIFVVTFTLLLFGRSTFQSPFTLDPLINLGSKRDQGSDRSVYVRRTLFLNLIISAVSIGILVVAWMLFPGFTKAIYARAAFLAMIPILFINLRFFVRNYYIMREEFFKAFVYDTVVFFAVVIGLVSIIYRELLDDLAIVTLLALAEAAPLILVTIIEHERIVSALQGFYSDLTIQSPPWQWTDLRQNWDYGKWLFLAKGANDMYRNAQFLLLPVFVPLANLAGYRACYMLAQPIYLFTTGLESFMWSKGADRMHTEGISGLTTFMRSIGVAVSVVIILYAIVVGTNAETLLNIAYEGKFNDFAGLLWFFVLAALFSFWAKIFGTGFRAVESTDAIFSSVFLAGVIGLFIIIGLTKVLGVTGAAISYMLASIVSVVFLSMFWMNKINKFESK